MLSEGVADKAADIATCCFMHVPLLSSTHPFVMRMQLVLLFMMIWIATFVPFDIAFLIPK